jgi:hypothetical protein
MDLSTTFLANTLENDAFANDLELFVNSIRDCQIIIGPAIKIEYFAALSAMYVMVVCHIRIESLGSTENFDYLHNPDFCESQEGAVYGIERNVGIFFFDDLINGVSSGMGVRIKELLINRDPLGGNFKAMCLTDLFELLDFICTFTCLHSYLK